MNVLGIHPANEIPAPSSYTQWTGASGILDKLGVMMGGAAADPAQPGSGKTGSATTSGDATAAVGPGGSAANQRSKMLLIAAGVVLAVFLLKKL